MVRSSEDTFNPYAKNYGNQNMVSSSSDGGIYTLYIGVVLARTPSILMPELWQSKGVLARPQVCIRTVAVV